MKKLSGVFVTGTDTEVGKTRISVGLVAALQQQRLSVAAMKPVASGCEQTSEGLRNEDALALMQQADVKMPYHVINPYAFEPAIAPHLAAIEQAVSIELSVIEDNFHRLRNKADCVVVEGAGGWLVPMNAQQTLADLAVTLQLPVIMVVSIKLGCINHALLTVQAIKHSGLHLLGWVANCVEPSAQQYAVIESLVSRIEAPCLGVVPKLAATESACDYLDIGSVLFD